VQFWAFRISSFLVRVLLVVRDATVGRHYAARGRHDPRRPNLRPDQKNPLN
jgi:hypothetical protein